MALAFSFDWSGLFTSLLKVQDAATSFGTSYFDLGCLLDDHRNTFFQEMVFYAVCPVVVSCIISGLAIGCSGKAEYAKTGFIITFFLLQPTLAGRTMSIFACIKLGSRPEDIFMLENVEIKCWSPEHMWLVYVLGLPMFVVYVLGIPLAVVAFLSKNVALVKSAISVTRANQSIASPELTTEQETFRKTYSFLFEGYSESYFWWETVILFRKCGMHIVAVLFSFNLYAQALFGLSTTFFALALHLRAFPFHDAVLNRLETMSLTVTSLTFFCGQFTVIGGGESNQVVSYIVVALNLLFVAVLCKYFFVVFCKQYKRKKLTKEVTRARQLYQAQVSVELTAFPGPEVTPVTTNADTTNTTK
jgi:hypothetical protein